MPDPVVNPAPASAPAPSDKSGPAFTMPEKFTGKSLEDVAKSYVELEKLHGDTAARQKDYDEYAKIGPVGDISEALSWARNMKAALDRGLIVPAGQAPAKKDAPAADSEPWSADDWAYKSPAEQAKAMSDFTQRQIKTYVDTLASQYGEQIKGLGARDGREKAILMKVIKTAIKHPEMDPEELLTQAAELGSKSPEELVDLVMETRSHTPEARKSEVDKLVETRLAEEKQKWEASLHSDLTSSAPRPRAFKAATPTTRQDEDRGIIEGLAKQGIRLI